MLPIDRPQKIVCVGLNYRDHAEEQGAALPEAPILFAKWPNTLIGPGEPIVIPPITQKVDYEAELGVVIGSRVRGVSKENALEAVAGYVCLNDVSRARPPVRGRPVDARQVAGHLLPRRPAARPASEVPDPQALGIRAILNGQTMQDSTTANMVFGVAEMIAFITPGDHARAGRPDRDRHAGRRRRVPRPAGLPAAGRRDHDRDRRARLADEPGQRRVGGLGGTSLS